MRVKIALIVSFFFMAGSCHAATENAGSRKDLGQLTPPGTYEQPRLPPIEKPAISPPSPAPYIPESRGAFNPRTGERYLPSGRGVYNPATGEYYPPSGSGYINPRTGEYYPRTDQTRP